MKKFIVISVAAAVVALGLFFYFKFCFVFGDRVKAGTLYLLVP